MSRSLTPLIAVVAGLTVAAGIAIVPDWRLESAVSASGLPALLAAAAPPLGMTARIGLMLAAGLPVTILLWIALTLLRGNSAPTLPSVEEEVAPTVRRADAHPDAPPRPPVRAARDLGAPFLDPIETVEPEVALPRDLDTPMAMFDPAAMPQVPAAPPPSLRPLFRPALPEPEAEDEAAEIVTVEFEPVVEEPAPPAPPPPDPEAPAPSIGALLDRLDRGLQRRRTLETPSQDDESAPQRNLASALGALRRMAGGE